MATCSAVAAGVSGALVSDNFGSLDRSIISPLSQPALTSPALQTE
jgi:hypothetical protein